MRLIDFTHFEPLNRLRQEMGAELNTTFVLRKEWEDTTLLELLAGRGADVKVEDIEIAGSLLEYKGQRVLLYIRDQYYYEDDDGREYKYHIAHCQTLERMWKQGRSKRYVVSTRTDGVFPVVAKYRVSARVEEALRPMNVCKNCLTLLRAKYPKDRQLWTYEQFRLSEFFDGYSTEHTKLPVHSDKTAPEDAYSDDWSVVSRTYRELNGWKCERCGGDFSLRQNLLHVHHKDHQKWNNSYENLEALCWTCHLAEPGHGQMGPQ